MLRLNAGPGGVPLAGAGFLPMIQPISAALSLQDSVAGTGSADSIVTQLPHDKLTPIIQWLFQRSPFVMWGGVLLALVIVFFFLRWFWPRRREAGTWFRTRSREVKFAMFAGVMVLLLMAAGWVHSYHFVETDKRFCNGCHIFIGTGHALVQAEFRQLHPRAESRGQARLHRLPYLPPAQSDQKEAVKLLFWMSGVRGKEIPPTPESPGRPARTVT